MSNRKKATKDDIGKKAWFSDTGVVWTDGGSLLDSVDIKGLYYSSKGCWWKFCEVECEDESLMAKPINFGSNNKTISELLDENAKLKAELAELKKGEVELEAWYLVDNDGEECARWLSEYKQWHAYPSMGFIGIFEDLSLIHI